MAFRTWMLGCVIAAAACAPKDPNGGSGAGTGDTGGASSDGGAGAGASSSGGSTSNGFETGGNGGNTNECASEAIEASISPLTMFITFDKSGSMNDNDKWTDASSALKTFVGDPGAADLEVALRFFPDGACNGDACDIGACATPNVDVGTLTADPAPTDTQEAALVAAIDAVVPNGGTPMSAALEGAIQWSTNYLAGHTDHKVVVILVTDGEPNGCEENIDAIGNIAMSGLVGGVVTYTVGLAGSNETDLQSIATKGGGSSFFIGGSGSTEADLLAALQAIRGEQLACELDIPEPTIGVFDPELVNVTYTPGDGSDEVTFGGVANEAACGSGGGWYYDNPADPQQIILCPSSCESVQSDPDGKIEVVLGCATIPG